MPSEVIWISPGLPFPRWYWKADGMDQISKTSIGEQGSFNHTAVLQLFNKVVLSGNCHLLQNSHLESSSVDKKAFLIRKLKTALTVTEKKYQYFCLLIYRCLCNLTWTNPLWLIRGGAEPSSQSCGHQIPWSASVCANRKLFLPPQ